MNTKSYVVLVAAIVSLLGGCGLILEDPRPYPPPAADAALSINGPDAGINERQMALSSRAIGFTVSVGFGDSFEQTIGAVPDSTLDWLCESSEDFQDASLCWVVYWMQP